MSAVELLVDARNEVGESPVWHSAEQALYWVDIPAKALHRWQEGHAPQSWYADEMIGCIAPHAQGGWIAGLETGIFHLEQTSQHRLPSRMLARIDHPKPGMRCNDGRCDRQGRFWVGTMWMNMAESQQEGCVVSYKKNSKLESWIDGLYTPNGMAFSPDGRTLYQSDSHPKSQMIWAWDMNPLPGRPDGAAVLMPAAVLAQNLVIKSHDTHPAGYPTVAAIESMGKKLDAATNGRIKIQMFAGAVLGQEKEAVEQTQLGAIQMARISLGVIGPIVNDVNVFNMPFVFRNEAHMRAVIDGPVGQEILDKVTVSPAKLVALGFMDGGSRSLYTKKKVTKPDDLKGQKVRMMGNPLFVDTMNAMGGNGIAMAYGEVFTSLQTGVLDGAENNPPSYFTANHYSTPAKFYAQTTGRATEPLACQRTAGRSGQSAGGARLQLRPLRRRLQRLRGQHESGRAGHGLPQETVRQTPTSNQRSQECGGKRLRAQIPGVCAVGWQRPGSQMCSGEESTGQLQGPNPTTHAPHRRAQHEPSGGETAALPAGLERVLRAGANARNLANAGRMAAPPPKSHPTQTLQAAQDDLPRTQGAGGHRRCCKPSGGKLPPVVAQQQWGDQKGDDHCVL
jgi:tripartite ATP-independent transporter DctP family solute receptor